MTDDDKERGTAQDGDQGDLGDSHDTTDTDTGTTETAEGAAESFINPADLPAELKPHWKRMHGAYTKKMQAFKEVGDKAALVDRFNEDPDFALQTLQQAATRMGYQFTKASPSGTATQAGDVPSDLVQAVKERLNPELQWMADSLAAAQWAAIQKTLGPMKSERETERKEQRQAEYDLMAEQLTEAAPGWEEHEDQMMELLTYLQSNKMQHRRFGSKLQLLHDIVTGNSRAVKEAVKRHSAAARSRTVSGQPGRSSTPNIQERVLDRKRSFRDVFADAAQAAADELEQSGTRTH